MQCQTNYQALDTLLSQETSPEDWEAVGSARAGALLVDFTANDWQELKGRWRTAVSTWQHKLARALVSGDRSQAAPLLLEMLHSADMALVIEAITALWNRFHDHGPEALTLSEEAILRIEAVADLHHGLMQEFILETLELGGAHPD